MINFNGFFLGQYTALVRMLIDFFRRITYIYNYRITVNFNLLKHINFI